MAAHTYEHKMLLLMLESSPQPDCAVVHALCCPGLGPAS